MSTASERLVIGVGNGWRGDDAAGLAAARLIRRSAPAGVAVIEHDGEPASLLETWQGARVVVIVDASASGAPAGTVLRLDALAGALPAGLGGTSTHGIGVAEAVELARALGRLPERLLVFCIEGAGFSPGSAISPAAERAAATVADAVLAELSARA